MNWMSIRRILHSKVKVFSDMDPIQLFKSDLPKKEAINKVVARELIQREIELRTKEIREMIKNKEEKSKINKKIRSITNSTSLLYKYIGRENTGTIKIKVYKFNIDKYDGVYKSWEEAVKISGGEENVAFISAVAVLMHYTRTSAGIIDKNAKSVLVLDNPFGSINAKHLLTPFFKIADHFGIQMVCFTGLKDADITENFKNVINLSVNKRTALSTYELVVDEDQIKERLEYGQYKLSFSTEDN